MMFGLFPLIVVGALLVGARGYAQRRLSYSGAIVSACLVYLGTMALTMAGVFFGLMVSGGHDPSPMFTSAAIFGGLGLLIGGTAMFFVVPHLLTRASPITIGILGMIVIPLVGAAIGNILIWSILSRLPAIGNAYWLIALFFLMVGGFWAWKLLQLELQTSREVHADRPN